MKKLTMGLTAVAAMALSTTAWAQNTTCPVKGTPSKANISTTYKGVKVTFC